MYLNARKPFLPDPRSYIFCILDLPGNFPDLNAMEEVGNIMKGRCESLPNNKFSPLWYFCRGTSYDTV